jgi:redox-sensitive bicupin YhaK (pirin superfamily)
MNDRVIRAPRQLEGAGFEVRRPLPSTGLEALGPYILLDHIGPEEPAPGEAVGAPRHPHAGLETLSYFIEGGGEHRDSLGNHSVNGPGEVQWMRAGRGIVHDEGPHPDVLRDGGRAHMVQLWLDAPAPHRLDAPAYAHFDADDIPVVTAGASRVRVIAGRFAGAEGPVATHTDPLLLHASVAAGDVLDLTEIDVEESGVYVLTGTVEIDGRRIADGELRLPAPARLASAAGAEVLVVGGTRLPRLPFRHGPFVAEDREQMIETVRRYQSGAFGDVAEG